MKISQAVILAAGESSRFWPLNNQHKSLFKIVGKPLIYWTIKGLADNGVKDFAIIVSPESNITQELKSTPQELGVNISYFIQEEPLGTGSAIILAKDFVKGSFFLVWGAKAFSKKVFAKVLEKYKNETQGVFVGSVTKNPWDYGIFKLEGDKILKIQENPKKGEEFSNIKQLGIYLIEPAYFDYYQKLSKHHEADHIDTLNLYLKDKKTDLLLLEKDVTSLKYPWNALSALKSMMETEYFESYISPTAVIGANVVINGKVYIGDNCQIGDNNILRGPVNLEAGVKTGAFFEIKNSIVQEDTHFHSGYVGDSVIGKNCRFGAGFITANRRIDRENIKSVVKGNKIDTHFTHLGAIVGNNTSFGIHTGTMPGVIIGSNSLVGPGTLVFENIPDNKIFYTETKGKTIDK